MIGSCRGELLRSPPSLFVSPDPAIHLLSSETDEVFAFPDAGNNSLGHPGVYRLRFDLKVFRYFRNRHKLVRGTVIPSGRIFSRILDNTLLWSAHRTRRYLHDNPALALLWLHLLLPRRQLHFPRSPAVPPPASAPGVSIVLPREGCPGSSSYRLASSHLPQSGRPGYDCGPSLTPRCLSRASTPSAGTVM